MPSFLAPSQRSSTLFFTKCGGTLYYYGIAGFINIVYDRQYSRKVDCLGHRRFPHQLSTAFIGAVYLMGPSRRFVIADRIARVPKKQFGYGGIHHFCWSRGYWLIPLK